MRVPFPYVHGCCVCASPISPFGVDQFPKLGKRGRWYCAEHLPEPHKPPGMKRKELVGESDD